MMAHYRRDVAYVHDVGFRKFALGAAPGLLSLLKRHGIANGLVVDLGCGSGLWARSLLRAGYEVLGIDLSTAMISIARKRAPAAAFRRQSLLSARLPRCAAVTSMGECLNYRFDPANSSQSLTRLFRRVHRALVPGGVFVFDVLDRGRAGRLGPAARLAEGRDWAVLLRVEADGSRWEITRRITVFRRVGFSYRRSTEVHRLRLFDASEVARLLRRAGFHVRWLRGYGRVRFARDHVGFVAQKRFLERRRGPGPITRLE